VEREVVKSYPGSSANDCSQTCSCYTCSEEYCGVERACNFDHCSCVDPTLTPRPTRTNTPKPTNTPYIFSTSTPWPTNTSWPTPTTYLCVRCPDPTSGDANRCDDPLDYTTWVREFNEGGSWQADFNCDQVVDLADLDILLDHVQWQ
jgi:hypothetical protein